MTTPLTTITARETTPPKEELPPLPASRRRRRRRRRSRLLQRRHSSSSSSLESLSPSPPPPQSHPLPPLNFTTYSQYTSQTSILSPRRSSRLLAKHVGFQETVATSDYGSCSITTSNLDTTTHQQITSSILSDELSILSIEDLPTSQPDSSSSSHNQQNPTIHLHHTHNSIYLLTPTTYNLRHHHPQITLTLLEPSPTLTHVQNTLQIHTTLIQLLEIHHHHSNNLHPLISLPTLTPKSKIHLYSYPSLQHLQTITPHNNFTTFYLKSSGKHLLIPSPEVIKIRRNLNPQEELILEIETPLKISVKFPPNSTNYELTTELRVHDHHDSNLIPNTTPAAPVIHLRPHSISFLKPVEITVEIVNYKEIVSKNIELKVYQCSESRIQEITFKIIEISAKFFITFHVFGFSYFRILWTCLTTTLTTAKLGLGSIFNQNPPGIWMKCQATMDEFTNDRFGLEISVYKSDYPEIRAYSHIVGVSNSKLVKFGKLLVNVKSELFEANLEAGEEAGLVKEDDFWGKDLNFQFSLKFKEKSIDRGPIGKVLVKHKNSVIFEFNIQKHGNEGEQESVNKEFDDGNPNSRWSTMALQELATNLFITDGDNWKTFAKYLKFTKHEIKTKFKSQPDPFRAIIDFYRARGGTPEEFIKCLYEVHRSIKFSSGVNTSPTESVSSKKSNKSSGFGSMREDLGGGGPSGNLDTEESTDDDEERAVPSPSSSRKTKSSKRGKPPAKKRKKRVNSEDGEESSDEKSKHNSSKSSQNFRDSTTLLDSSTSLWAFSIHLTSNNWKALGRSLQLEESNLVNIEQAHKASGNRECFYQVLLQWRESYPKKCTCGALYAALVQEGMVAQAKKMKLFFTL